MHSDHFTLSSFSSVGNKIKNNQALFFLVSPLPPATSSLHRGPRVPPPLSPLHNNQCLLSDDMSINCVSAMTSAGRGGTFAMTSEVN